MTKIASEDELMPNLTAIEHHIKTLKTLNKLRIQMFGTTLIPGWEKSLREFNKAYSNIPNITRPTKIHILLSHCDKFIKLYGQDKGLGFFSEQTGEAVHQTFEPVFNKYKIKKTYILKNMDN